MLVSHDRALLREVCDEFWLVAQGALRPFDGDLDDYQRWLLDVSRAAQRGQPAPPLPSLIAVAAEAPNLAARSPVKAPPVKAPPVKAPPAAPRDDRKSKGQARNKLTDTTRPLRVEVGQIDKRLEALAAEKHAAEAALSAGTLAPAQIADHGRRLNHIAAEVAMLEERWLELHAQLEALQAAAP